MKLEGKVAIVTGGSQNLGKGIVKELINEGAKVVIADLEASCGAETAAGFNLEKDEEVAAFIATDVSSEEMMINLMEKTVEKFGRLDILVNNAGILVPQIPIEEMSVAFWDKVMAVNLKGVFLGIKEAGKVMVNNATGGSIITISSAGGIRPRDGMISYAASKSGAILATQVAAREYATRGVRCNIVAPGPTDAGNNIAPELVPVFLADVPMKKFGTPEDIGKAVVFLASDDAKQITGVVLPVDGGRVL